MTRYHEDRTAATPPHPQSRDAYPATRNRLAQVVLGIGVGALFLLALTGCVSARAEYDPQTGALALRYWRLGDIELDATATRDAAGRPVVSIHSVSQAAALNTAVAALAALAKSPTP